MHVIRRLGLLTVAAGLALVCAGPGVTWAAAPLSALALNGSDVPAGFKQVTAANITLQLAAKRDNLPVSALRAQGWSGSYESTFQKKSKGSIAEVESTVDRFKGTRGASWDLTRGLRQLRLELPGAKTFKVRGLGSRALGFVYTGTSGAVPFTLVYVIFTRGGYLAATGASAGGTLPAPPAGLVESYARTVYGRLAHS